MPYVNKTARNKLDPIVDTANMYLGSDATIGDMNYLFTRLMQVYLGNHGGISYTNINNLTGMLQCAGMELYRRVGAPYEDQKIAENGDVY